MEIVAGKSFGDDSRVVKEATELSREEGSEGVPSVENCKDYVQKKKKSKPIVNLEVFQKLQSAEASTQIIYTHSGTG